MKKGFLFLILSFTFINVSLYSLDNALETDFSDLENRFQQALSLQKTSPDQAEILFGEIASNYLAYINIEKMSSPGILYNAGNSFYMAENYGMAIFCYKRALLLQPGNSDLQFNLNAARLARRNDFSRISTLTPKKIILFWHYYFSDTFKLIICIILLLSGFALIIFKNKIKKRKFNILITVTFLILILFSISLFISATVNQNVLEGVITADEVILRKGDNTSYTPAIDEPLYSGAEIILLKKRNGWLYISIPGLAEGWIKEEKAVFVE